MSEDVILQAFQHCITKFGVQTCLNTNWLSRTADFFPTDDIAVMKEYEIITLKYDGKACRLYLFYCGPSEDIIL